MTELPESPAASPAIKAAGAAIRMARYLSCSHTDEQVARLAVNAYEAYIKEARAATPRKPRRRRKAVA
jgi:hypothetical protein